MRISYPLRLAPTGRVAIDDDPAVELRQDLIVLVGTNYGERVMLNTFGVNARGFLFDDADEVSQEITAIARDAVARWVPGAVLVGVSLVSDPTNQGNRVLLEVQYQRAEATAAAPTSSVETAIVRVGGDILEA